MIRPVAVPFHYGWVIAVTGVAIVFVALGLGRFALGMQLPAMAATLELSYAQMGFIGTGNFIGYLGAVLLCGYGVGHYGARTFITAALLIVGLTLLLISQATGFVQVLILYFLTGVGSGGANVPIMGLVSHWFAPQWRGRAAGIIVTGNGLAIMFSGVLLPAVSDGLASEGWRTGWLVFAIVALVVALACGLLLRNTPQELELPPLGGTPSSQASSPAPEPASKTLNITVFHLGILYFLFGFTYGNYATFIVTTLVEERGFSQTVAGNFWFWLGFISLFSGLIFGTLSDHLGRKAGLALVFALQGTAYFLVAFALPAPFLYLSIGLFGLCAWSIPSIMAATVGDYMGPRQAVTALGIITFFFGIGQIAGPALAGVLAEASQSFASSYLLAAVMAAVAVLLTMLLRKPKVSR